MKVDADDEHYKHFKRRKPSVSTILGKCKQSFFFLLSKCIHVGVNKQHRKMLVTRARAAHRRDRHLNRKDRTDSGKERQVMHTSPMATGSPFHVKVYGNLSRRKTTTASEGRRDAGQGRWRQTWQQFAGY